ncbi:hypothetical protein [Megasphaera lornae]|nr:hypothetical protein [Megasphaera genomosp. type_1]
MCRNAGRGKPASAISGRARRPGGCGVSGRALSGTPPALSQ